MSTASAVWGVLLLIVNFFGILAGAYYLCLRLLRVRRGERYAVLLPVCGQHFAADRLYAQCLRAQMLGEGRQCAVIALDVGLCPQQRGECERFCRCTKNLYYSTPETLPALLEKLQKER